MTAGATSTLTINTGTAAAGNYTLTVTGTAASATHSATSALTITPLSQSGGITNGGFETGETLQRLVGDARIGTRFIFCGPLRIRRLA